MVPASEPNVPQSTTKNGSSLPRAATNPANGMINSDGRGGKMFSRNINAAMAG